MSWYGAIALRSGANSSWPPARAMLDATTTPTTDSTSATINRARTLIVPPFVWTPRASCSDTRGGDSHDLVDGEVGGGGMSPDRLRARCLDDADAAERPVALLEHVAVHAGDVVGHACRLGGRARVRVSLRLLREPGRAPDNQVRLHLVSPSRTGRPDGTAQSPAKHR